MENQAVCGWGVRVSDLTQDDPAVYISYDGQEWLADHDRLSEFLHGMAFLQGVFGLAFASEEFIFINDKELAFIKDNFAQKPYGLNVWSVAFYGDDNDVIAVFNDDGKYNLAYASNNEQGFDKLFNYNRQPKESFTYRNTMTNGSISEQFKLQELDSQSCERKIAISQDSNQENLFSVNLENKVASNQKDSQVYNTFNIFGLAGTYSSFSEEQILKRPKKKKKRKL